MEAWKFWEQISITVKLSINLGKSLQTDQSQQTDTSSLPGGSCKACIRKMQALGKPKKSKKKLKKVTKKVAYHDENQEAITSIIVSEPQIQNPFAFFEKSAVVEYAVNEDPPTMLLGDPANDDITDPSNVEYMGSPANKETVGDQNIVDAANEQDENNPDNVENMAMVEDGHILDGITEVYIEAPAEAFETVVSSETDPAQVVTIMPNGTVGMDGEIYTYTASLADTDDAVNQNAADEQVITYELSSNTSIMAQDDKMYCPGQTICIMADNYSVEKEKKSRRKKSRNKENVHTVLHLEADDHDEEYVSAFENDQTLEQRDQKSVRRSVRKNRRTRRYRVHDYCNIDSDGEIMEEPPDGKRNKLSPRKTRKGSKTRRKQADDPPNLTCSICNLVLSNIGALNGE